MASVIDITEHYHLQEERQQYEFIVNASEDSMNLMDDSYVYRAVNDAFLKQFGKSRFEIIGHKVSEVWGSDLFLDKIKPKLDECLTGKPLRTTFSTQTIGETRQFFSAAYYPYKEGGKVTHIAVVSRDMTEETALANAVRKSGNCLKNSHATLFRDFLSAAHYLATISCNG